MSDIHENLEDKIKKGIEKSGFPLEMETGRYLKEGYWYVQHSPLYFNIENVAYKEYDILASRTGANFDTKLYVECKHSKDKQWVFFAPDDVGIVRVQDLRFFPIKPDLFHTPYVLTHLKETVFKSLEWFSDDSKISLNSTVFAGEKRAESQEIGSSISSSIRALISDNVHSYDQIPKIPQLLRPTLNLSIVVFDGQMYIYSLKGGRYCLEKTEYIKYRHDIRFDVWKHDEYIRRMPMVNRMRQYEQDLGSNHIVEIIHKDLFPQYIRDLLKGIEELNKIPILTFIRETSKCFNTRFLVSHIKKSQ